MPLVPRGTSKTLVWTRLVRQSFLCAAGTTALGALLAQAPRLAAAPQEDKYVGAMLAGENAIKQHKYEDAVAAFKQANTLQNKSSIEAYLGLARAYLGLGAFKNAIQSCDDALKYTNGDKKVEATIRNQRGNAITASAEKPGDPKLKDAEADYRAVLALTDAMPIASFNLGVTLMKLNRDAEGIHELEVYIPRGGRAPEVELARKMIDDPRRARMPFAPEFSITTMDGEFVELKELKGKVVLLDFWGTWCPPCREATSSLVRFSKKYPADKFVMIGVGSQERDEAVWKAYITEHKMEWPQYLDKTRKLDQLFQITGFPTYIVIDHEGIIKYRKVGWGSDSMGEIDAKVKDALKKAS